MAELKKEEYLKEETLSVSEYSKKYGNGLSSQALSYAMNNDKIDFIRLGNERFIVMTEKTKQYVPNKNPKRAEIGAQVVRK